MSSPSKAVDVLARLRQQVGFAELVFKHHGDAYLESLNEARATYAAVAGLIAAAQNYVAPGASSKHQRQLRAALAACGVQADCGDTQ